jgi:hypothetical protein
MHIRGGTREVAVWHKLTAVLSAHYLSAAQLAIAEFRHRFGIRHGRGVRLDAGQHGGPRAVVIKGDARAKQ